MEANKQLNDYFSKNYEKLLKATSNYECNNEDNLNILHYCIDEVYKKQDKSIEILNRSADDLSKYIVNMFKISTKSCNSPFKLKHSDNQIDNYVKYLNNRNKYTLISQDNYYYEIKNNNVNNNINNNSNTYEDDDVNDDVMNEVNSFYSNQDDDSLNYIKNRLVDINDWCEVIIKYIRKKQESLKNYDIKLLKSKLNELNYLNLIADINNDKEVVENTINEYKALKKEIEILNMNFIIYNSYLKKLFNNEKRIILSMNQKYKIDMNRIKTIVNDMNAIIKSEIEKEMVVD
jgi:hypothetical protein